MAHNLNENNGKTAFASTQKAWHGLGQIVDGAMTSSQAIKLAGLDYEVAKTPVLVEGNNGFNTVVPEKYVTYRKDNNDVFGIVGSRYEIVQNRDAFDFFDSIIGAEMAIFETAGALGKGERVFISAKMLDFIRIENTDDITEVYTLLTSSHDGSGAVLACITPIRVVCSNTLNMALKNTVNKVSIRHTTNVKSNLENAHRLLGISHAYVNELNECFNHLAKKKMNDSQVTKFIEHAFETEKKDSTRIKNIRESVLESYFTGTGQETILGTAWGAYNAVTHYLDHIKSYKNSDVKFESILEGESSKIATKAANYLLDMK
ncbi:MAG: DUF932 domain-containing protein [Bacteroidia bacterium]